MPRRTAFKCYFGCTPYKGKVHRFPSLQYSYTEKINQWKMVLSEKDREKGDIYLSNNIHICDHHFEDFYRTSSGLLTKNAVPTLNIEGGESTPVQDMCSANPDELAKNPAALKEAYEQMATLDVFVCGQCHSAFHFIDAFKEHKDANKCTGKSPVRDSDENKAQVWAFLLWKCSSFRDGFSNADDSWKLYQQWCRMPKAQRTAWITVGLNVQSLSKFAHAKVMELKTDDQLVPVPPATPPTEVRKHRLDDSETHPCGEESDDIRESPGMKANKTPLSISNSKESKLGGVSASERDGAPGQYVLAKRFNSRRQRYEYLLKWKEYPHDQNTWEPLENMESCKPLLEVLEKQLAKQKEQKTLGAEQQRQPVQVKQMSTPSPQVVKQIVKTSYTPALTPTGRLQRTFKVCALNKLATKKIKKEASSDYDDHSDSDSSKFEKKILNKLSSLKSNVDPMLVKSLGLGAKGERHIKAVIKMDPKHMPNLATGVYIMSKNSGFMKVVSPGKLGPALDIDQDFIRKQLVAAKQKKIEAKKLSPSGIAVKYQIRKSYGATSQKTIITTSGKKVIQRTVQRPHEQSDGISPVTILNKNLAQIKKTYGTTSQKTTITTSGKKVIQRTVQRPHEQSDGISPVTILNKNLAQSDSLLRLVGSSGCGGSVSVGSGKPARVHEKTDSFDLEKMYHEQLEAWSDTSDGIEDPFPRDLGPLPPPSPKRELTLCPTTGWRLARAESEPSPPPTPPPATPTMLLKMEMSPGGTGMLVQEGQTLLVPIEGVNAEDVEGLEGGVMYVTREDRLTYLAAQEVENLVKGAEGPVEGEAEGVTYVVRDDGQNMLTLDPAQLAQLMSGGDAPLPQVTVQVEGELAEDVTQVIAHLVQADVPSPGGSRRVVLLLPDGTFTITELDKEQYESITEAS